MKITQRVFDEIIATVGAEEPETGGALGLKNNIVCSFYFDKAAAHNKAKYSPDTDTINEKIATWQDEDIYFSGLVHSHPNGCDQLSVEDETSIKAIFDAAQFISRLYFPIVTSLDNKVLMTVYKAKYKRGRLSIKKVRYRIVSE